MSDSNYDAEDVIPISQAAKLLPSHVPGRKIHIRTIYRWISEGKLTAVRRGRYYFVTRASVLALMRPALPKVKGAGGGRSGRRARQPAWVQQRLEAAGIA
jgi:excisionase family DNA binding protein